MEDVGLTYTDAEIIFLGFTMFVEERPIYKDGKGEISLSTIRFWRDNFLIAARIEPYCLPRGISRDEVVQREVIQPAIDMVNRDIDSIKDRLDLFMGEEAVGSRILPKIYWKKAPRGYKLYDFSQEDSEYHLAIQHLTQLIEKTDNMASDNKFKVLGLSRNLHQKIGRRACMYKGTLEDAMNELLRIYNSYEDLKELVVDAPKKDSFSGFTPGIGPKP